MLPVAHAWAAGITRVLCVGAHADDIEIGCGGTVLALLAANPDVQVDWLVLSAEGRRATEARAAATRILGADESVRVEAFTERFFPAIQADLKHYFDVLGTQHSPDLVFAPRRDDAHQDHRVTAELVWQTFRDHLVLEYEIAKYEGDLGQPNAYVALDASTVDEKLAILGDEFGSQHSRDWFDPELFRGLLRIRGAECRAPSGYAEAFHASKLRLW